MTVSSGTLKTRNINFASLFCKRFQPYHANKALRYFVRSLTVFFLQFCVTALLLKNCLQQ